MMTQNQNVTNVSRFEFQIQMSLEELDFQHFWRSLVNLLWLYKVY